MSYIKELLYYIMMTVEIVDDVVYGKLSQYSFLTDSIIIKLNKNPNNLKLIEKEISEVLNARSYNDAVKIIKNRYNSEKTKEKRKLILSIMEHDYNKLNNLSSSDDSDSEQELVAIDYEPFEWKPNQRDAIDNTMATLQKNKSLLIW